MKKLRHSKFKNTGVLFELLVRQLTSDTLNNTSELTVLEIIKKHFNKTSILTKELDLYKALLDTNFNNQSKADKLVEEVVKARKRIDSKRLTKAKYELIKDIKHSFDLEDFFKTRVRDYKESASIFKIFEYSSHENPTETVNCKFTILEHITNKPIKEVDKQKALESYTKADKDLRLLSYKILVDRFNGKYTGLNRKQKALLKEYINNISNTTTLKDYVQKESKLLNKEIIKLSKKVSDKVVKIKLNEVSNLTNNFSKIRTVKDSHILGLLRYYELIKELKNLDK